MTVTDSVRIPDEFRQAFNDAPDDFTLRLVVADWFAERGEYRAEEALRWSVAKRRKPHISPVLKGWYYWEQVYPNFDSVLPADTRDLLPPYGTPANNDNRSVSTMFDRLIAGWEKGSDDQRREWWAWNTEGCE